MRCRTHRHQAALQVQRDVIGLRQRLRVNDDLLWLVTVRLQLEFEHLADVDRVHQSAPGFVAHVHARAMKTVRAICGQLCVNVLHGLARIVRDAQVHAPDAVETCGRVPHVGRPRRLLRRLVVAVVFERGAVQSW